MRKRIYVIFLALIILSSLLLSASVSRIVYVAFRNREIAEIKEQAGLIGKILDMSEVDYNLLSSYIDYEPEVARITLIAPNGSVIADNKASYASLENHMERREFQAALRDGWGEATRYSDTLRKDTYYYALRLKDGNVLRVSKTMSRISSVFFAVLPAIAGVTVLVLAIANMATNRLSKYILQPLENIDFDGENQYVYEELAPYAKKINTQKKELAEQMVLLADRADTIEAITRNMPEGFILFNKAATILAANKSALDIFGYTELEGSNIMHICREIEFRECVAGCLSGTSSQIILERGEKIYEVYFSYVGDSSQITGGVVFLLDISYKHQAEIQRKEFSANVSHELKTPLTTISALSEMMANGIAKENDTKEFSQKIFAQSQRLINIIEDIIKLSEFDEGVIVAENTEFDLLELAQSVAGALQGNAEEKQVGVKIIGEPFNITANRQMIDELLYNLIDNGIKYNNPGGEVVATLSKDNGVCKISVADTGIGIPVQHQDRVFERFYRIDKSRSKKTGGTGLGLAIIKRIVEYHDGHVELASDEGKGTTVDCYIVEKAKAPPLSQELSTTRNAT
ncbi:MAG: ATP-binding protein [Eubacteriaceae bacterium]|nr:ATP-binding protein [Eubacteriaceae bacterium]